MKTLILSTVLLFTTGTIVSAIEDARDDREGNQSLRVHQTTSILYPYTLLNSGVTSGDAHVGIAVDPAGLLTDLLVVGYSHREFADAAVRAIREWDYTPMRVNGEPVASRMVIDVNFEAQGVVINITPGSDLAAHLLSFRREHGYGPCTVRELDAIPAPLEFVAPAYPSDLKQRGVTGEAVVDFYIDETGAVRLAAVTCADFTELGALAVNAVEQWKFAPPTRHGQPVLVHVEQRFVFGQTGS